MKRRESDGVTTTADRSALAVDPDARSVALSETLARLEDPTQVRAFLTDLCTLAEIEALADRWSVVPLLDEGLSYRAIHERTGVSVTTIGRVAKCLEHGAGGYRAALDRHRP